MKKSLLLPMIAAFVFLGCEQEKVQNHPENAFQLDKTEILFDENITIVKTQNLYTDFIANKLFVGENVSIENGIVQSKIDGNLWFVPFDKNGDPILIGATSNIIDPIVISCDCAHGTINLCNVADQENPDGTTTFTCNGGCVKIDDGVSNCSMSVTVGRPGKSFSVDILNGIIISSESIEFNDKIYSAKN